MLCGCAHHSVPDLIQQPNSAPPAIPLENINVALVLSGGGARAVSQAGVIEMLERHHIPIDLIVGCSAGSIIGALYADDPNAKHLKRKIIELNKSDLLDLNWFSSVKMLWQLTGPVEGEALKLFIQKNVRATDFKQLKIPLVVVATNIDNGKTVILRSGALAPALHASSAVPLLFNPVRLYGKKLVDGGVSSPVPVEIAKKYHPKIIIAIDIGTSPDYGPVDTVFQLAMRSLHISYFKLSQWQNKQADVVIHPDIDSFGMFEDKANHRMYKAGQEAGLKALPEIKKLLSEKGII